MTLQEKTEYFKERTADLNVKFGALIDAANSNAVDLKATLQKKGLFKREVKHAWNEADREFKRIFAILRRNTYDVREVYIDTLDAIQEQSRQNFTTLYWPIRQVLDRHNVPNSEACAYAEVVQDIAELSALVFDAVCDQCQKKIHFDMRKFAATIDPTGFCWKWNRLRQLLCHYPEGTIDALKSDANIAMALEQIAVRYASDTWLEKAIAVAMEANPDSVEAMKERTA